MIHSKKTILNNFVVFDKAEFEFTDGMTVVRGPNRSGKSLLFSALGNLIYGVPPISSAKRQSKQMHVRSGSRVGYEFEANDRNISIIQGLHGQSVRYTFNVDGETQTLNANDGVAYIRELIPCPEDLFYSTKYIAGARRNTLHAGSGVERLRFLETMFEVDSFDRLRERLGEILEKARKKLSEAEALKAELATLPDIPPVSDSKMELLRNAVVSLREESERSANLEKIRGIIETLEKTPGSELSTSELRDQVEELSSRRDSLYETVEELKKGEELHSEYVSLRKERMKVLDAASRIGETVSKTEYKKLKKKFIKMSDEFDELEKECARLKSIAQSTEEVRNIYKEAPSGFPVVDEFFNNKSKLMYEWQVQSGLSAKTGDCPYCGKPVTEHDAKKIKKEQKQAEAYLEFALNLEDLTYQKGSKAELESALKRKKELSGKLDDINKKIEKYDEKNHVEKRLSQIDKALDKISDFAEFKSDLKRQTVALSSVSEKLKITKEALKARTEIDRLKSGLSDSSSLSVTAINRLVESYTEFRSDIKISNSSASRREKIKRRLEELGNVVEHEEIISTLYDAYGPRGIRVDHMNTIAKTLERSFNSFAPSFFPEPMYFSFDVSASRADVSVERNALGASDAVMMSNSEARCFQILCFAALSPHIPERYRFDSVILDEVEAMMDPVTRKMFVTTALPQIRAAVRSVTVVTPLPEDELFIETDRTINVVKERSRSRLEIK